MSEQEFHEALIAAGLIENIKPPRRTQTGERRLMQVKGQPLSEAIIEGRGSLLMESER